MILIELGIIHKNIFYLNNYFKELEDNYNIIRLVNSNNGNFIIFFTYIPPYDKHSKRLAELIYKLKIIRYRYNNLVLILYGDLNIKREDIRNKLGKNIEPFGYEIIFNDDVNEFTQAQLNKDKEKKSYLDYFIVDGIKNYDFS